MIALARHLGFAVIAEGIGTRKQERQLRALRCDYAQGYCYAKPLDSHAAARFLIKEQVAQPDEGYGKGRRLNARLGYRLEALTAVIGEQELLATGIPSRPGFDFR